MARRVLLLSASMGAGHDTAAHELADRLRARGDEPQVVDLLACLPAGIGAAIKGFYAGTLRFTPWLYELIYRHFLEGAGAARVSTDPVVRLALPRVRDLVASTRPDAVVPLWHVAAQVTGALRADGELRSPVTVAVTELAVHPGWIHPGNDRHLCVHQVAADEAAARGGADPIAAAPLIPARFVTAGPDDGLPPDVAAGVGERRPVVITAGAWGAGAVREAAAALSDSERFAAVVLCGRNDRLRRAFAGRRAVVPLGWRDDVRRVVGGAAVIVQNGGGLACWEALSVGRPVVTYRPLPGHGRAAAAILDRLGLAPWAHDAAEFLRVVAAADGRPAPRVDIAAMPDAADLIL